MLNLLLMAAILAANPVPRHTPSDAADSSAHPKPQANASDSPTTTLPSGIPNIGSNNPASKSGEKQTSENHVTIFSSEPLRVDSIKDWRDKSARIFGFLLTILTGFQVFFLKRTLEVVAEQSRIMARQAAISREALVAQFRPKVVVRRMRLDPPAVLYFDRRKDGQWKLEMQLHNSGGTVAHVLKCETFFQIHDGSSGWSKDNVGFLYIDTPFDIPAGGKHPLDLTLEPNRFRAVLENIETAMREDPKGDYESDFLAYHGTITYRDENGLDRDTGFSRNWNPRTSMFIPSHDTYAEYQE